MFCMIWTLLVFKINFANFANCRSGQFFRNKSIQTGGQGQGGPGSLGGHGV